MEEEKEGERRREGERKEGWIKDGIFLPSLPSLFFLGKMERGGGGRGRERVREGGEGGGIPL
jgi:hypothetical protein